MPLNYNINPATQPGVGAYGTVPGPIGVPPSIWDQMASINPNLGQQTANMFANIGHEQAGELSPETVNALRNKGAAFGVTSGLPLSQFSGQQGLTQLGLNVEQMQQTGDANLMSAAKTIGSMQTDPGLASAIADRNATLASAPNPQQAAEQAIKNAEQAMSFAASLAPRYSTSTVGGGGTAPGNAIGLPTPGTAWGTGSTTTTRPINPGGGTRFSGGGGSPASGTAPNPADPWSYMTNATDPWNAFFGNTTPATSGFPDWMSYMDNINSDPWSAFFGGAGAEVGAPAQGGFGSPLFGGVDVGMGLYPGLTSGATGGDWLPPEFGGGYDLPPEFYGADEGGG